MNIVTQALHSWQNQAVSKEEDDSCRWKICAAEVDTPSRRLCNVSASMQPRVAGVQAKLLVKSF